MLDLIIKNGSCFIEDNLRNKDIGVKDGKIIQIEDKIEYNLGQEDVYPELKEKVDEIQSRYNDASGFIGIFGSPTCGIGVGVKNKGGFTRGLMHVNSPFPTTEIGHFKNLNSRKVFLEKIRKEDTL